MIKFNGDKLALAITHAKEDKDVTYRVMSQEAGVSYSSLCRLANKEVVPDIETLLAIVKYLKMDLFDFFDGDEYLNLSTLPASKKKRIQDILREQGSLSIISDTE